MTKVYAVKPEPWIGQLLGGADFIDAYRISVPRPLSAMQAAQLMLERPPAWSVPLMRLRNALVRPFGLRSGRELDQHAGPTAGLERIGIFPIQSATPRRVVLGFPDKHLDFRVVVDVAEADGLSVVTATTLVRFNNLGGRLYLIAITPFHKLIVRASLARVAAA